MRSIFSQFIVIEGNDKKILTCSVYSLNFATHFKKGLKKDKKAKGAAKTIE